MMKAYLVGVLVSIVVAAVTGDGCDTIDGLCVNQHRFEMDLNNGMEGTLTGGCDTIDGSWVNQHGSEMDLKHDKEGTLTGIYTTKVESEDGAAGKDMKGDIIGVAEPNTPGVTFGFSVMWVNGLSTTVWTGQCHMCDGEPTIMTSWLLRSKVTKCGDIWQAVQIGQDYFTRKTAASENHQKPHMLDTIITSDGFLGALAYNKRHPREAGAAEAVNCEIPGIWYNPIGSKLDASHIGKGILRGDYWTVKEVQSGKLTGKHSRVHGHHNDAKEQHTMAYFVSWNKGESVTGWVGQCHLCNKTNSTEKEAVLETTWFHRVAVTSCHANWKSTLYGQTSFRRNVQRIVDPDDDVVGEFGEEVALCPPSTSSTAATYRPLSALTGLALIYVLLA